MTQQKIALIQRFYTIYLQYWKSNSGLDVLAIQQLPEEKIQDRIDDYIRLLSLRKLT